MGWARTNGWPPEQALAELQAADERSFVPEQSRRRSRTFWADWRAHYGDDGFKNPRGDRLLTELALWAIRDLKPRLMMINYQDPDYVHWGNASHYTRAIAVIDDGIRQVVEALDRDDHYANNTVVVITPDCGRDANPSDVGAVSSIISTRARRMMSGRWCWGRGDERPGL